MYTYLTFLKLAAIKVCPGVVHLLGNILLIQNVVYCKCILFFCAFYLKYSEMWEKLAISKCKENALISIDIKNLPKYLTYSIWNK